MSNITPYITRVAPSPTGNYHLGTARTAYFNYLAARATGGTFILRIDDTDNNRNQEDAVKVIYDAMAWLGMDYDNTFRQSQKQALYQKIAGILIDAGFAKFTNEDKPCLVLINPIIPDSWVDTVSGEIKISDQDKDSISKLVLMRNDGLPTYHFASVVDDADCHVNYIIRGQDHLSNTIKHICIYNAMNACGLVAPIPKFAHVGLIYKDGKKLSKRDGASSILGYRDNGYNPAALLNFMLRLGWSCQTDALIDKSQAIDMFFKGNMRPVKSGFDQAKLEFFNKKYKSKERLEIIR